MFFCVHFGLTEAHRGEQLRLLAELIRKSVPVDAPLLVAGRLSTTGACRGRMDRLKRVRGCGKFFVQGVRSGREDVFPARPPAVLTSRPHLRAQRRCSRARLYYRGDRGRTSPITRRLAAEISL